MTHTNPDVTVVFSNPLGSQTSTDPFAHLLAFTDVEDECLVLGPTLTQDPLIRGQDVQLVVTDAEPGEIVIFAYSLGDTGDGPCFPALGGLCVDLLNPQRLDSVTADASGTATLKVTIPLTAPAGQKISTQAVIRRGVEGAESVKTNPVTDVIQ